MQHSMAAAVAMERVRQSILVYEVRQDWRIVCSASVRTLLHNDLPLQLRRQRSESPQRFVEVCRVPSEV